jgi:hypothetical protein
LPRHAGGGAPDVEEEDDDEEDDDEEDDDEEVDEEELIGSASTKPDDELPLPDELALASSPPSTSEPSLGGCSVMVWPHAATLARASAANVRGRRMLRLKHASSVAHIS